MKRTILRWGVPLLLMGLFMIWVVWLNRTTEKVPLVSTEGQTFEHGVVTEVLEDNVQEDGTRVGQQTVLVRMTTGEKKRAGSTDDKLCRVPLRRRLQARHEGDCHAVGQRR